MTRRAVTCSRSARLLGLTNDRATRRRPSSGSSPPGHRRGRVPQRVWSHPDEHPIGDWSGTACARCVAPTASRRRSTTASCLLRPTTPSVGAPGLGPDALDQLSLEGGRDWNSPGPLALAHDAKRQHRHRDRTTWLRGLRDAQTRQGQPCDECPHLLVRSCRD